MGELNEVSAELGGVLPVQQPHARVRIELLRELVEHLVVEAERRKQRLERGGVAESGHRGRADALNVAEVDPLCRAVEVAVAANAAAAFADLAQLGPQGGRQERAC